jgi:hypothetical protein
MNYIICTFIRTAYFKAKEAARECDTQRRSIRHKNLMFRNIKERNLWKA